jgi:hypothetical protein
MNFRRPVEQSNMVQEMSGSEEVNSVSIENSFKKLYLGPGRVT